MKTASVRLRTLCCKPANHYYPHTRTLSNGSSTSALHRCAVNVSNPRLIYFMSVRFSDFEIVIAQSLLIGFINSRGEVIIKKKSRHQLAPCSSIVYCFTVLCPLLSSAFRSVANVFHSLFFEGPDRDGFYSVGQYRRYVTQFELDRSVFLLLLLWVYCGVRILCFHAMKRTHRWWPVT